MTSTLLLARSRREQREQAALWPEHTSEQELGLVCSSERMLDLIKTIRRVAPSNLTILITGETGVGKELLARAVIGRPWGTSTFLPFNCATVPRDMLDNQLFGHRRGLFTGAQTIPRRHSLADGGTLFLDEIGDDRRRPSRSCCASSSRAKSMPLGEAKRILSDVRVVVATNADLSQLVRDGRSARTCSSG